MKKTFDKEKMITTLTTYHTTHHEYPTTHTLESLPDFPTAKWIQRHGGIINFYRSLGLTYVDARTGLRRAAIAANKKSQSLDTSFATKLVSRYGEENVHWQAPYNKGITLHRSDFKVYHKKAYFFVDLFFPQDMNSFSGCVNSKLKKLARIKMKDPVYLISCNTEYTTPYSIKEFVANRKTPVPSNIHIMHIDDALKLVA